MERRSCQASLTEPVFWGDGHRSSEQRSHKTEIGPTFSGNRMCDFVGRKFFAALLLISILAGSVRPVSAYTPDDPKVRSMVESAKGYLAANEHRLPGGKALQALVFVKDEEYDHPMVASAVKAAEEFAAQTDAKLTSQSTSYEITSVSYTHLTLPTILLV